MRWGVAKMSWMIPGERLVETEALLAFHHPRPSYKVHVLLVPKRPYADILALPAEDTAFLADLVTAVQRLVAELGLADGGYRLINNGGTYQDVPHLHFHLIAGEERDDDGV